MPKCPECQEELSFVCSWMSRGLWGYYEVRTYECPAHGPIFMRPRTAAEQGVSKRADNAPETGDRDSFVAASRKPTPPCDADAIAIPEPLEPNEPEEPLEPFEP